MAKIVTYSQWAVFFFTFKISKSWNFLFVFIKSFFGPQKKSQLNYFVRIDNLFWEPFFHSIEMLSYISLGIKEKPIAQQPDVETQLVIG